MGTYYLDIETTGLDPELDKIVTIQYQKLNPSTGKSAGELIILKEWEHGEAAIIKRLIRGIQITSKRKFDCVLTGNNLMFEHGFLSHKTKEHGLPEINIMADRPMLDMHAVLVLMNHGNFQGSGLDKMTGKRQSGGQVGEWYKAKKYDTIIEYIKDEAQEYTKLLEWLYREMPRLHKEFISTINAPQNRA